VFFLRDGAEDYTCMVSSRSARTSSPRVLNPADRPGRKRRIDFRSTYGQLRDVVSPDYSPNSTQLTINEETPQHPGRQPNLGMSQQAVFRQVL